MNFGYKCIFELEAYLFIAFYNTVPITLLNLIFLKSKISMLFLNKRRFLRVTAAGTIIMSEGLKTSLDSMYDAR
jgi:hypothetical protein